jgi:tRNA(Leu) C34 or U34 (ribose-2'-O)-methylase TrmL
MLEKGRCLNLSNSVGIVGYEVLRQFNFEGLKEESTFLDNGIK